MVFMIKMATITGDFKVLQPFMESVTKILGKDIWKEEMYFALVNNLREKHVPAETLGLYQVVKRNGLPKNSDGHEFVNRLYNEMIWRNHILFSNRAKQRLLDLIFDPFSKEQNEPQANDES
jgi:hypothetical protein